ncbi:MAG: hypothetical protein NC203_03485 [Firmicutes bacterium]|nr:hypothetical protein [[Eubacterium] siraeum]MCM1487408.1 hypothetical protein [Bacillota bacterium]
MYKKQLTFQKIVCFAMLAMSAIVFLYSLGIMTDLYDTLYYTMPNPNNIYNSKVEGSAIYYEMQTFNGLFTNLSIGMIIVSLFLFVTCTHSRRKYYIGNYIAVVLSAIYNIFISVWSIYHIDYYKARYLQVDFAALKEFWENRGQPQVYTDSTFWFDISYVIFGLLLFVTLLLIANTILKVIMMKEEKRLIGSRKDVKA